MRESIYERECASIWLGGACPTHTTHKHVISISNQSRNITLVKTARTVSDRALEISTISYSRTRGTEVAISAQIIPKADSLSE